jgi:hypothetical protein
VLQSEINAGTENKTRLEINVNQVMTDFLKKDWYIALRCTVLYTNDDKTVPDTSLHETSDRI